MGLDLSDVRREQNVDLKHSFFRHQFTDFTVDFIPTVGGNLSLDDCYSRRHFTPIFGTEISILSLPDLIATKNAAGRKKDLDDIAVLEEMQKYRSA